MYSRLPQIKLNKVSESRLRTFGRDLHGMVYIYNNLCIEQK